MAEATPLTSNLAAGRRIGVISMHTSPTASLGQNGNGGLNVYVREVANAFSERGIATDIFTRRQSPDDPAIESLAPLSRVIYLPAGIAPKASDEETTTSSPAPNENDSPEP